MENIRKFFRDWTLFEKTWLVVATVLIVGLSIYWKESTIAILSALAGIVSVVLCAKGKIENYYFGMFQAVTYAYICFQSKIYGEVMYNVLMVPMIIFGYWNWKRHMNDTEEEVRARNLTPRGWVITIVGSVAAIAAYSFLLKAIGGSFALIDATSTTLSLVATILMLTRFSEQWLMWILVNVASVALWVMAFTRGEDGGVTLMVMWSAYLLNSIYGYINWRKMAREN